MKKMTKKELTDFLKNVEIIDEYKVKSLWRVNVSALIENKVFIKLTCPSCGHSIRSSFKNIEIAESWIETASHTYCGYCGHKNIV